MCRIAGYYCWGDTRPSIKDWQSMWEFNQSGGVDAAGLAYQKDSTIHYTKEDTLITDLVKRITPQVHVDIKHSPYLLLHNRAQTKGSAKDPTNNHPVIGYNWVVTHNGVIDNDDEIIDHLKLERLAVVDSIAINAVLGHGTTLEESLSNLSVLSGSATIAAIPITDPNLVVLARLYNSPCVYYGWDSANRILYWSSEYAGLYSIVRPITVGPLQFTLIEGLEANMALVLTPVGVGIYRIGHSPFIKAKAAPPIVVSRSLPVHYCNKKEAEVILKANYKRLEKPSPLVSGFIDHAGKAIYNIRPGSLYSDKPYETGYGRWVKTGMGNSRIFYPHKRIKRYWLDDLGLKSVILPADMVLSESLVNVMELEKVQINHTGTRFEGLICPWCGALATMAQWRETNLVCPWCLIKSITPKVPEAESTYVK